jgi:hypothetical protein
MIRIRKGDTVERSVSVGCIGIGRVKRDAVWTPRLGPIKTYTLLCMCCTGNVSIVLRCLSSTMRRGIWGALQTLLEQESDRPKSCATCEYVSKAIQASLRFSSLLRVDHQASCAPFEMGHRDARGSLASGQVDVTPVL